MRLSLVIVLSFLLPLSFAQAQVQGQGRFQALDDDSVTFVRNQLIAAAFRDVVQKELTDMGLDANGFWERFNQRLEINLSSVVEDLREKHGMDSENVTARQRQAYENELRVRRLNMQANLGGLARAITSYSVKNQSRSTQGGATRFMSVEARVDRRTLNSIYSEFMREGRARYFHSLIIKHDFELRDATWSDVGVKLASDFTRVLENHWSGILRTRLQRQVGSVVVADSSLRDKVDNYMKIPREISQSLAVSGQQVETLAMADGLDLEQNSERAGGEELDLEIGQEVVLGEADPERLSDSLLLQIAVRLTKIDEDEAAQSRTFSYQGELLLIDLRDQSILASYEFPREKHTYTTQDDHQLSSSIATQIARTPTGQFDQFARVLSGVRADRGVVRLQLHELSSIQDFYAFSEVLTQKGVTAEFTPRLIEFNGRKAIIDLDYKGDPVRMMNVLRELDQSELSTRAVVNTLNYDRPYEFRLFTPIGSEVESDTI